MYIGMYINNIHILYFVIVGIIGLVVGQFVAWMNLRMPNNEKVFTLDFFKELKKGIKSGYLMMAITAIGYMALLYKFGIKDSFINNLELIKYLVLYPMLVSTFFIDLKHRIIPNRFNLTIFEVRISNCIYVWN